MNRSTPFTDREIERIEEMGAEAAMEKLWRHDADLKRIRGEHKDTSWTRRLLAMTIEGLGALGITVVQDEVLADVLEVKLPISGYFKDALKEREAVSIQKVGQIKGHGYHDPCIQALIDSGRLKDV